jgi:hypothetical protein
MNAWIRVGSAVVVGMSLARPALVAHHSFAGVFDGAKVIRLNGVITKIDAVNPHSVVYLDTKKDDGSLAHWALEGPSIFQLARRGLDKKVLRVGESIEACGYLKKDDAKSTGHELSAQLVSAELLILTTGEQIVWSNYGQGKCLSNPVPIAKVQGVGTVG